MGSEMCIRDRPGSDIDLTLYVSESASKNILAQVSHTLDELNTPYRFDVSLFRHIDNPNLIKHILRVGVVVFNAEHQHHKDTASCQHR